MSQRPTFQVMEDLVKHVTRHLLERHWEDLRTVWTSHDEEAATNKKV